MSAPDDLRRLANQELKRVQKKLDKANFDIAEAQSELEQLKLILTEIKWVQDESEAKEI